MIIKSDEVVLSICCITYNQELFLSKALNGFLAQEVSFPIEIIIYDDYSTDNTRQLLLEFKEKSKFPVKLILSDENKFSKGERIFIKTFKEAKGKYIALCEADDFWTDSLKLQKQVDFLEVNNDVNICFHRANVFKENKLKLHDVPNQFVNKPFYYIELLRHFNFITTASVVFRVSENLKIPNWYKDIVFGDLGLYKLVSQDKKIQCLDDVMSVYNIHNQGIWSGLNELKSLYNYLFFYKTIFIHLNNEEKEVVKLKLNVVLNKVSKIKAPKFLLFQKMYFYILRMQYHKFL